MRQIKYKKQLIKTGGLFDFILNENGSIRNTINVKKFIEFINKKHNIKIDE